jgi:hypothetical protein
MRTVFHLFVVKRIVALNLMMGQGLLLTLLDIIKFFDKQSLIDACDALNQPKVNNKFYRVWYKLNEATEIQSKNGTAGLSARGLAGPKTSQWGGGTALPSALNLNLGVQKYFWGK